MGASQAETTCAVHHLQTASEACAAWLSADAARDAVFWGQVQAVTAILGVIGLLATLIVALQANRATRRSSEDQLRAWSKVTPHVVGNLIRSSEGCSLAFEIQIENIGATPAIDVELFAELYSKGDIGMEVQRFAENVLQSRGAEYPCTLFTQERVSRSMRLENDAYGSNGNVDSLMLSLIVGVRYRTVFDRQSTKRRLTFRVYDLSNGESGLIQANRGAGPGSLVLTTNIMLPGIVT